MQWKYAFVEYTPFEAIHVGRVSHRGKRDMSFERTLADILKTFHTMVVDWSIPVELVHCEFMKVEEYRRWSDSGMDHK